MQLHVELLSSAIWYASSTVFAPGVQGEAVAGMHGCGVSTPIAAAVAAATCGLDGLLHMPNGAMLTIGMKSWIAALGWLSITVRRSGRTARLDGLLPNVHASWAPFTTWHGMV
jgi:hypothetical protein